MPITNPIKRADQTVIPCGGTFSVTMGMTASPEILKNPADIVLILDVSGSMQTDNALELMKAGAENLLEVIIKATGGTAGQTVGNGSRLGLVSFSSNASVLSPLTDDAASVAAMLEGLTAGGLTNHGEAFMKAQEVFEPLCPSRKVMILFTDGTTTTGPDPNPIAEAAKSAGAEIYCIGLKAPADILEGWASNPSENYVMRTTDPADLEALFTDLGRNVVNPGVVKGKILETTAADFRIISISAPSVGTARQISERSLEWTIEQLGAESTEDAVISFTVQHIGTEGGKQKFNESAVYSDSKAQPLAFPDPEIEIQCDEPVVPDPCPVPVTFSMDGCEDSAVIDLNDFQLSSLGRIVQLSVTIQNVCPNRRTAAAVQLTELGSDGKEYPRGQKIFTIPAHTAPACRDIRLECIRFILPEDLDVSGGSPHSLCSTRTFRARVMANYIDTDFVCCPVR